MGRKAKRTQWIWVAVTAVVLLLLGVSWSKAALIPIGNAHGLDIQVDFRGYDSVVKGGAFSYGSGKTLHYQVIVTNRSNTTFNGLELQSMLQGIETKLPGARFSSPHKLSLSPGQTYRFDVEYKTPDLKAGANANLIVNTRYNQRGTNRSDTFRCPTPVRFE